MIDPKELRISNWIFTLEDEKYRKVFEISDDSVNGYKGIARNSTPILLTPQILDKAGFSFINDFSYSTGEKVVYKVWRKGNFVFNDLQKSWWYKRQQLTFQPTCLHHLQNVYFWNEGEELTIDLS